MGSPSSVEANIGDNPDSIEDGELDPWVNIPESVEKWGDASGGTLDAQRSISDDVTESGMHNEVECGDQNVDGDVGDIEEYFKRYSPSIGITDLPFSRTPSVSSIVPSPKGSEVGFGDRFEGFAEVGDIKLPEDEEREDVTEDNVECDGEEQLLEDIADVIGCNSATGQYEEDFSELDQWLHGGRERGELYFI